VTGFAKTNVSVRPNNKGTLMFWFKRSDFYVTGMDFVFSRIALMTQATALPFYLDKVCGYEIGEGREMPY